MSVLIIGLFVGGFVAGTVCSLYVQRLYRPMSSEAVQDSINAMDVQMKALKRMGTQVSVEQFANLSSRVKKLEQAPAGAENEGGIAEQLIVQYLMGQGMGQGFTGNETQEDHGIGDSGFSLSGIPGGNREGGRDR